MPEAGGGQGSNGAAGSPRPAVNGRARVRSRRPAAGSPVALDLRDAVTGVSAGAAMKLALAGPVARIGEQLAEVRRTGDPECVHQARVAIRRLRSDLSTFSVLFRPGSMNQVRAEMGWLADLLGNVRDADILRSRLAADSSQDGADGPPSQALVERVGRERERAETELLTALRGKRFGALHRSLKALAKDPPFADLAEAPADAFLPLIAAQPWGKLQRAVRKLDKHAGDQELHAVRIAAKRSRYAAEAVTTVIGKPAERFASAVAALQEALGEYNDAVVSARWLRQAVVDLDPSTAFVAGRLSEHQEAMGRAARQRWPAAWKRLDRKKVHAWLADA